MSRRDVTTKRIAARPQQPRRLTRRGRRGMTSTLAMLYLVLFGSLAVGFYAAVNTSVQVSGNETRATRALLAAESGMSFVRHVLSNVQIPHGTRADAMWDELVKQVKGQLDGKDVVNGQILQDRDGVVELSNCKLESRPKGATFSARLIHDGDQVAVQITGNAAGVDLRRRIQMSYGKAQRASAIFDYGVASRSAIVLGGNAKIRGSSDPARGSVLSTSASTVPLDMSGVASISGDFSWTNSAGQPRFGSNTKVANLSPFASDFPKHLHDPSEVIPPEFPIIDTSVFEKYVPSATAPPGPQVIAAKPPSARTAYTNVRIKAGVNPEFSSGTVLTGVIFVETPNQIKFSGGVTIKGVIVVENDPKGDITTNTIYFGGNVAQEGVESLPDSFGDLKKLTGSSLLAPNFAVTMRGNSNAVGGTMVVGAIDISGNAAADVKGSVINMQDRGSSVTLKGTGDIIITAAGTSDYPAGVYFGTHYVPLPDTYKELSQ